MDKINKKIFIYNCITFICLLIGFFFLNYHLEAVNYEYSYRNYINYEYSYKNYQNDFNFEENKTEPLKIKPVLIGITAINLILLLNNLYYLMKYYKGLTNK
jgi:hypothetical protein